MKKITTRFALSCSISEFYSVWDGISTIWGATNSTISCLERIEGAPTYERTHHWICLVVGRGSSVFLAYILSGNFLGYLLNDAWLVSFVLSGVVSNGRITVVSEGRIAVGVGSVALSSRGGSSQAVAG
jgi:hypothetical protein